MKNALLKSKWLRCSLSVLLLLVAGLYAVALVSVLTHGGCCLFYQTERLHESISIAKHTFAGITIYSILCCALFGAAMVLEKNKSIALGLLAGALLILMNDTGGALNDSFMALPWVPEKGVAFEDFFSVRKIPDKVWYGALGVVAASMAFCMLHIPLGRRVGY